MVLIEALNATSVVYSDTLFEGSSYCDYCSLAESLLQYNPDCTSRDSHLVMNYRDKGIYTSLGSSSFLAGNLNVYRAPYFILPFCNPDGESTSMDFKLCSNTYYQESRRSITENST